MPDQYQWTDGEDGDPNNSEMLSRFALPAVVLVLVHVAAVLGRPELCLYVLLAGSVTGLAVILAARGPQLLVFVYAASALVLAPLVVLTATGSAQWAKAIFIPPIVVNLGVAIMFGATLRPGHEPLVTRLARFHHKEGLPQPLLRYTRILTILWAGLTAAMAIEAGVLAAAFDIETWSWAVNIVNPLILVAFFIAQFWYRAWRYREFGKISMMVAVRQMLNARRNRA
jgi:uncharacterized membrane protein